LRRWFELLQCSPAKALAGLYYAKQYMRYGFTTLDPEWPTINLRDAIDGGMARGLRLRSERRPGKEG
jgi:hypothetical protein